MSKEELAERLGQPDIRIIDVRANWEMSRQKIKGAVHQEPGDMETWINRYDPSDTLIVYCSSPNEKESRLVAESLDAAGFSNIFVLGGGWVVWESAQFPTEKRIADPLPKGVIPNVEKR
jgi:rhodanese-related sulfurtransferase